MQNGYYTATGAMVTQFNKLDVITNNLANVNTTGFKRDDVVVGDFMRILKESRDELYLKDHTKEAAKFINRSIDRVPQVVEQYTDFSKGIVKQTSTPLDFALKRDDLFFLVETPNGVKLTQNGSFALNEKGEITTKEGYKVAATKYFANKKYLSVPENASLVSNKSGKLYANNELVGKLFIAQVENQKELQKEGDGYYKVDDIYAVKEIEDGGDYLMQGYLQGSNVNAVKEMVSLIETNRLVSMYQKVMHTHMNDLNNESINKLASVRA